ncbi:MAG: M23 family metallopeptidase [Polyangiales bacterium]
MQRAVERARWPFATTLCAAVIAGCATTPAEVAPTDDAATEDVAAVDGAEGDAVAGGAVGACVEGLASAQFRAEVRPPAFMAPGSRARVSVTFDNCSGAAWRAGEVSLVPAAGVAAAFGVARVALAEDVPDGGRVTIPFEVQAPREPGVYRYAWAVARDGGESFQQRTPEGEVTVQDSSDCTVLGPAARFRGQSPPPAFVGLGEPVRATVTFANCGAETWTREAGFHLASALAGESPWGTARVELPRDVPFGGEVTIPVEGVAPSRQGRYGFAWVMQREGARVGEPTPEVGVTVLPRGDCAGASTPSRFVGQNHPSALDPNQSADVDITFANCSDDVWNSAYRINAASPATDGRWGAGNVAFPLDVGPGFQLTVPFRIRAPGDAGSYPYRWVVTRGGADLAEPSPARDITVRVIDTAGPCQARPVAGNVTSPYGWRVHPITGRWTLHTGIDFGAGTGTHIYACRGGTVVRASWYGGYGNATIIDHGGGMRTLYGHQSRFGVSVGQHVSAGQHIGYVGSTGNSTGAHLHFEVYINGSTVDPARGYL